MSAHTTPTPRIQYWQQQVEAWTQTELSGAQFCQAQGLVYHQFIYWRQKLLKPTRPLPPTPQPTGFAQVTHSPHLSSPGLSLLLPNGIEVHGIEAQTLSLVPALLAAVR